MRLLVLTLLLSASVSGQTSADQSSVLAASGSLKSQAWWKKPPLPDLSPPQSQWHGFVCGGVVVEVFEPTIVYTLKPLPQQCVALAKGKTPLQRSMFRRCVLEAKRTERRSRIADR